MPRYAWIVFGIVFVAVLAVVEFLRGNLEEAKFVISVLSTLGVIAAVLTALYGDALRMWAYPIHASIEAVSVANSGHDTRGAGDTYLHHLRVKNHTPQRPLIKCRVWLEHIEDEVSPGKFEQREKFAVPRLMDWAPAEFSPEERTFSDEQVFDFGETRDAAGNFHLRTNNTHGGYVKALGKLNCPAGNCRRYYLKISAENYVPANLHVVEVRAGGKHGVKPMTEIKIIE